MLLVKTYISKSNIHGNGLFAAEFIPKGTLVWKLNKEFDNIYTSFDIATLPFIAQEYIIHYSHFDEKLNRTVLCGDNARFFNRSENPNCGGDEHDKTFALRDILPNEELTEIYYNIREFKTQK